ncbi:hypothetical protein BJ138DRAFT_909903 [Hygrophoropsis aurantiaca]|uniref:Uncharacterized protein n=1 Tax=Hygrophoropsis aurantiaca TaxID=72124 RepID=A0ACB8AF84_9AGAM|nr:hypothetical protein BJ138DRAFT_909903 [Hygrophoropsis aurantiaca]
MDKKPESFLFNFHIRRPTTNLVDTYTYTHINAQSSFSWPVSQTLTGPSHKPKRSSASETYKLPWSVAEQHLLEELAQERNRWSKISLAMHGRRTPQQVASRVQKYCEKLSRAGVERGG